MLFPDLNLAEGRNCPTGSKPKADTFSSDILMVSPKKRKLFHLIFNIQGTDGHGLGLSVKSVLKIL
jgi:hypothetical protein